MSGSARRTARAAALAAALCLLLAAAAARADVLVLKDGRRLEGKVSLENGIYRVEMKYGALEFPMADVADVVMGEGDPGPAPPPAVPGEEAPSAPGEAPDGDAEDEGADAGAAPVPAEIELPSLTEEEKASLAEGLPTGALHLQTEHFAIVSTASPEFTKKRAGLFERVREGFYRYFARRGFALKRHERRLEAVIFADEASFRAFVRRTFPQLGGAAVGFYTTSTNRLYFFDRGTSPDVEAAQANLARFEGHLEDIKRRRRQAESAGDKEAARQLSRFYRSELKRFRKFKLDVEDLIDEQNEATTIHETVHQLCYNSDLLIPSEHNPEWLVEGLAMLFEDPAAWQGRHVGAGNEMRVGSLARHVEAGKQIRLAELIGSSTPLIDRGDPSFAYASSWALVHYLVAGDWRRYKDRFFAYVQAVRAAAEADGGAGPDEAVARARLELFAKSFGDVDELEKELVEHVAKLIED